MKEMWKKYKRQIQITGGICLIAVLGIGGICSCESGCSCADTDRDEKGDEVL